jgi:hypothetical protein
MNALIETQREFFRILAEFFERATGTTPERFAKPGGFGDAVRANARAMAPRGAAAFSWLGDTLSEHYNTTGMQAFAEAASLRGLKTVLGGTSRFNGPQLASVRKMALYVDTVLIPDPILPWFEEERREERFRHVLLLETAFWLLRLKPLVDADGSRPTMIVFPSWERGLEAKDVTTQTRQQQLVNTVIAAHTQLKTDTFGELLQFARERPTDFMEAVDNGKIFWAPGADGVEPLSVAIERYRAHIEEWRSAEWIKQFDTLPAGVFLLNALLERVGPMFHLLENADELRAQPMLCVDSHWFYYGRVAAAFERQLAAGNQLAPQTVAKIRALQGTQTAWLERVPIEALARLRTDGVNETFRRRLDDWTVALHGAAVTDLDQVTSEIAAGLRGLLHEHARDVDRIRREYQTKHKQTLTSAAVGIAALFLPTLAPYIGGAVPLTLLTKYGWDKLAEGSALKRAARSLTGVLAKAQSGSDD